MTDKYLTFWNYSIFLSEGSPNFENFPSSTRAKLIVQHWCIASKYIIAKLPNETKEKCLNSDFAVYKLFAVTMKDVNIS
jgi:hypothetical protein